MRIFTAVSDIAVAASHSVTNVCLAVDEVTEGCRIYATDFKLAAQHDVNLNSEQRTIDLQIAQAAHAKRLTQLENL